MPLSFYSSAAYRNKQATITRRNWKAGIYSGLKKQYEIRRCKNIDCVNVFRVKPGNLKVFCSRKCSSHFNNLGRKQSVFTRYKISRSVSILPKRGFKRRKKLVVLLCKGCGRSFEVVPYLYKTRKYCSNLCAIRTIGRQTTSSKALRSKTGIRSDVDSTTCFYSTWEANVARVFNLLDIKWQYAPKIFDLGKHTYRPDFYLSDYDMFVEVKNFMGDYSQQRDRLFRQKYPAIKLELILKADYLNIKSNYKELIDSWEK